MHQTMYRAMQLLSMFLLPYAVSAQEVDRPLRLADRLKFGGCGLYDERIELPRERWCDLVPALLERLEKPLEGEIPVVAEHENHYRANILFLLGEIEDERILRAVAPYCDHQDALVRKLAIACLGRQGFGEKLAYEKLNELLGQKDTLLPVYLTATVDAVGYAGASWAGPILREIATANRDANTTAAAKRALSRLDILHSGGRELLLMGILEADESSYSSPKWYDDVQWACWMVRKLKVSHMQARCVELGQRLVKRGKDLRGMKAAARAKGERMSLRDAQTYECTRLKMTYVRRLLASLGADAAPQMQETVDAMTDFLRVAD